MFKLRKIILHGTRQDGRQFYYLIMSLLTKIAGEFSVYASTLGSVNNFQFTEHSILSRLFYFNKAQRREIKIEDTNINLFLKFLEGVLNE